MTEKDEYKQLEQAYDAMRKQFDAIRDGDMQKDNADLLRQLRSAQDQMVVFGESLFFALKGMEAQDKALSRSLAQLDRSLAELKLRRSLGQIPALSVEQASAGRVQLESGQKTLRMNYDNAMLQLASMTGAELGETLALGTLPEVTAEMLEEMDLEADLEQAKERSYELLAAYNTYKEERDKFDDAGGGAYGKTYRQKLVKHNYETACYTYENQIRTFELNFRTLYAQVKDCAQVLSAARSVLTSQKKSYAATKLKYQLGNISANALADARDELAEAEDAVTDAGRELFVKYRSYQWAVNAGILQ